MRSRLEADATGIFVHDAVLAACRRFGGRTALVDTSYPELRRISYAEYGELVERLARGMVAAGVRPGEVVAVWLYNSWEFATAYHAATLAGAIPTPLNPSYRDREVHHQLEDSGAAILISDGVLLKTVSLEGLPKLRRVFATRGPAGTSAESFSVLLQPATASLPTPAQDEKQTLAALPYSSGTTGLPKGVMLSHSNLVTNCYQTLEGEPYLQDRQRTLCFLPLYHIYGLNVVLNPQLMVGGTVYLMPRFDPERAVFLIATEGISWVPLVPPVMNVFCQMAEAGRFPRQHRIKCVKSGAAPLAPELARRFRELTGIMVGQGYGMTEASPVTHIGVHDHPDYDSASIGWRVAETECRLMAEGDVEVAGAGTGELVMRGPQFMLGYWNAPAATAAVLRDGWYWSGDVARRDHKGLFYIVDRRKEMIKYKGFPVAPAEVESVLLEHPAVRDCGVVGLADAAAGEIPCAFVVLRDGHPGSERIGSELSGFVAERLTPYKQPREVRFVANIPRNPSGKILRRELRKLL